MSPDHHHTLFLDFSKALIVYDVSHLEKSSKLDTVQGGAEPDSLTH